MGQPRSTVCGMLVARGAAALKGVSCLWQEVGEVVSNVAELAGVLQIGERAAQELATREPRCCAVPSE